LSVLTTVTLANSNSALPDYGDYTETCWSCFNVKFNTQLKSCASVGLKTLMLTHFILFYRLLSSIRWF